MTDKLKQIIEEGSKNLPREIVEVINSFDWVKMGEEIGKKYLIDENEVNILLNEIGFVLVMAKGQDTLAKNIEYDVGTTQNDAMQIVAEINEKIFNPMLKKLELSVRNSFKYKNANWKQTVNFIVSGGNYSAFLEKDEEPKVMTNTPNANKKNNFTK